MKRILEVSKFKSDEELAEELRRYGLSMKPEEARLMVRLLGRDPTLVEAFIFDIEWSEHCSYKSSKTILKSLPTEAPNVILGPEEDAGIIYLTTINGVRYGIVIAHESHNHPSQLLPVEGAATGIGGIVRDVDCMGARVFAVADPLRFGDPTGPNKERVKWIASGVVQGIWEYANALGVPNIGGDVYFDECYDDNCLVNVVALGVVREDCIIHSRAPQGAGEAEYDIILVGKPTDRSGFGGATFASEILDEEREEEKKGAVQVHDPFLKNVLLLRKANEAVWHLARERGVEIGMKDLGAGGIACASSEMGASGGYGIEIDLDRVHVAFPDLLPEEIACSETQERYMLMVPPSLTEEVLKIYNEDWDLPNIYEGARASVIGKVKSHKRYILRYKGEVVCDAPIDAVTEGICYTRSAQKGKQRFEEPIFQQPADLGEVLLALLSSPNIASREYIYRFYDTEVQGNAVIRPGEADAGVFAPLEEEGSPVGVALSCDGNPRYGAIDPYWGGATAVAEAMRNVACVGAVPSCLTDCLNFGNPENEGVFWQFAEAVRGISDAARHIGLKGHPDSPVPIVSGNVSFYNESAAGRAIHPSPIIACVGIVDDYSKCITMRAKDAGDLLVLVGERRDELGGSQYYKLFGHLGANVVKIDFQRERGMIYGVIDAIHAGLIKACHDISEGGLAVAVAEMLICGRTLSMLGAEIDISSVEEDLRADKKLFSESSGFIMEIERRALPKLEEIFSRYGIKLFLIGHLTHSRRLIIRDERATLIETDTAVLRRAWQEGLPNAMR